MQKTRKEIPDSVFLDTDAVIALVQIDDSNHSRAINSQKLLSARKIKIYTSNFVIGEIITVLSQKSKVDLASKVGEQLLNGDVNIIYITKEQMEIALNKFSKQTSKNSRFTDMVNMVLMDQFNIDTIFSFDKHYVKNGYNLLKEK